MPVRSSKVTSAPRRARKYAAALPMTPPPTMTTLTTPSAFVERLALRFDLDHRKPAGTRSFSDEALDIKAGRIITNGASRYSW
jgi:hypothetical protein